MKTTKPKSRKNLFIVGPATAYAFYVLLLLVAFAKPTVGNAQVDFRFLTLWGVIILLGMIGLILLKLIRKKEMELALFTINIGVSIAVIFLSIFAIALIEKNQPATYSCQDFVRCLIN